jgi:GNAT superfamily N-acetyltransferase
VVRTYLELRALGSLRAARSNDPALRLGRATPEDVPLFRQLYDDVGQAYHWRDKHAVPDAQLRAHFESPDVALWVLYHSSVPAGFFELRRQPDKSVEIAYFGLTSAFLGRGLGKHLLSCAVEAAWSFGADRVWLHTCTLDSPAALPNYLARGFEPFKIETYEATVGEDQAAPA